MISRVSFLSYYPVKLWFFFLFFYRRTSLKHAPTHKQPISPYSDITLDTCTAHVGTTTPWCSSSPPLRSLLSIRKSAPVLSRRISAAMKTGVDSSRTKGSSFGIFGSQRVRRRRTCGQRTSSISPSKPCGYTIFRRPP